MIQKNESVNEVFFQYDAKADKTDIVQDGISVPTIEDKDFRSKPYRRLVKQNQGKYHPYLTGNSFCDFVKLSVLHCEYWIYRNTLMRLKKRK